jgi:hypothetical protein
MSIVSAYENQPANTQEAMDVVAQAFLQAPNNETNNPDPFWLAMYGDSPRATEAQALVPDISAQTSEPLLIIKGGHAFVPQILTAVEQNQTKPATSGFAYIIRPDGRRRGSQGLAGFVGLHAYRLTPDDALVAGIHPILFSHRHVGSPSTKTESITSHQTVHIGQTAIVSAIRDKIESQKTATRNADTTIALYNERLEQLRTAIQKLKPGAPIRHI